VPTLFVAERPRIADVTGFHDDFGILKEIPIATCCTAINHSALQETLILVCHKSLYFGARTNLNDCSALEVMSGETPDISTFTNFDFYQFVIYYDPNDSNDDGKGRSKLARWLGPSESLGQGLCYYLLKLNRRYIARSTV
jgi:hypothetical protein